MDSWLGKVVFVLKKGEIARKNVETVQEKLACLGWKTGSAVNKGVATG